MTLSAHRHRDLKRTRKVRVWDRGIEVTKRCFYVDGRRKVIRLYRLNAAGRKYIEPGTKKVAPEEIRGNVKIVVGK